MRSKRNWDLYGGGALISAKEAKSYVKWVKNVFKTENTLFATSWISIYRIMKQKKVVILLLLVGIFGFGVKKRIFTRRRICRFWTIRPQVGIAVENTKLLRRPQIIQ